MAHSGRTSKGRNYPSTPGHPNPTRGKPANPGSQRSSMASSRNKGQRGMEKRKK